MMIWSFLIGFAFKAFLRATLDTKTALEVSLQAAPKAKSWKLAAVLIFAFCFSSCDVGVHAAVGFQAWQRSDGHGLRAGRFADAGFETSQLSDGVLPGRQLSDIGSETWQLSDDVLCGRQLSDVGSETWQLSPWHRLILLGGTL